MNTVETQYIGFRTGLLSEKPLRLRVLKVAGGVIALEKPVNILVDEHPWYGSKGSIVEGIRKQLQEKKPELERLGVLEVHEVFFLEPEITGTVLFVVDKEKLDRVRNMYGSEKMEFTFRLLAVENADLSEEVECDLPIAPGKGKFMEVSHVRGKKCKTTFCRLQRIGGYSLWEAKTEYIRLHQIRIHAHEVGLRIVGDKVYSNLNSVYLSDIKSNYRSKGREDEMPLYGDICLHLGHVKWPDGSNGKYEVECPLPKKFKVLLEKLEKYAF